MKILLLGSTGQVGWQLRRSLAVIGDVIPLSITSRPLCGDLRRPDDLIATVLQVRPDVVVNAAAYTAVDRAEAEASAAFAVNAEAPEFLAKVTDGLGAWLVHYSSDYVYDGSGEHPWREDDLARPYTVYGRSKLAGDLAVVRHNPRHLVLRTSWVYETRGLNFARTILSAAAERDDLSVVSDQWGAPTRGALVADVTAHALRAIFATAGSTRLAGLYHVAASGVTSWHGYAQLLLREAVACGLAVRTTAERVLAIPSSAHGAVARRPANSRLDTSKLQAAFGLCLPPWQDGVRQLVAELAQS